MDQFDEWLYSLPTKEERDDMYLLWYKNSGSFYMVKKTVMECDVCHKTYEIEMITHTDDIEPDPVMEVSVQIPDYPDLNLDMCKGCRKNMMVYLDQFLGLNLNVQ